MIYFTVKQVAKLLEEDLGLTGITYKIVGDKQDDIVEVTMNIKVQVAQSYMGISFTSSDGKFQTFPFRGHYHQIVEDIRAALLIVQGPMTYDRLKHMQAKHELVVRFGSNGTQRAQFVRFGKRASGDRFLVVMKYSKATERWVGPVGIDFNDVISEGKKA